MKLPKFTQLSNNKNYPINYNISNFESYNTGPGLEIVVHCRIDNSFFTAASYDSEYYIEMKAQYRPSYPINSTIKFPSVQMHPSKLKQISELMEKWEEEVKELINKLCKE